jgi:hypothetical protein
MRIALYPEVKSEGGDEKYGLGGELKYSRQIYCLFSPTPDRVMQTECFIDCYLAYREKEENIGSVGVRASKN